MYVLPNIGWIRPIDYPHQLSSETIKSTKIKTLLKFSAVAFCGVAKCIAMEICMPNNKINSKYKHF